MLQLNLRLDMEKQKSSFVEIVDYLPKHHTAFKRLNEAWNNTYFTMEEADTISLNNPNEYILKNGGEILVALLDNTIVGVCALIKLQGSTYDYELAKMAVSPKVQGRGIGHLLGKSVIDRAKSLGASTLYLESNTALKPAISLYDKLGFQKVVGQDSPYERSNIQMVLHL